MIQVQLQPQQTRMLVTYRAINGVTKASLAPHLYDFANLWQLVLSHPHKGFIVRGTFESNLPEKETED